MFPTTYAARPYPEILNEMQNVAQHAHLERADDEDCLKALCAHFCIDTDAAPRQYRPLTIAKTVSNSSGKQAPLVIEFQNLPQDEIAAGKAIRDCIAREIKGHLLASAGHSPYDASTRQKLKAFQQAQKIALLFASGDFRKAAVEPVQKALNLEDSPELHIHMTLSGKRARHPCVSLCATATWKDGSDIKVQSNIVSSLTLDRKGCPTVNSLCHLHAPEHVPSGSEVQPQQVMSAVRQGIIDSILHWLRDLFDKNEFQTVPVTSETEERLSRLQDAIASTHAEIRPSNARVESLLVTFQSAEVQCAKLEECSRRAEHSWISTRASTHLLASINAKSCKAAMREGRQMDISKYVKTVTRSGLPHKETLRLLEKMFGLNDFARSLENKSNAELEKSQAGIRAFITAIKKSALPVELHNEAINLFGGWLKGMDLSNVDLKGVTLCLANLENANLAKSDLRGAFFGDHSLFQKTDFTGSDLRGVLVRGMNKKNMILDGTRVSLSALDATWRGIAGVIWEAADVDNLSSEQVKLGIIINIMNHLNYVGSENYKFAILTIIEDLNGLPNLVKLISEPNNKQIFREALCCALGAQPEVADGQPLVDFAGSRLGLQFIKNVD